MKRRIVTLVQRHVVNPPVRLAVRLGLVRGLVLLETRGRKTGKERRNPVGAHVDGTTVWVVAEHGRHASYIRNLLDEPTVRVLLARRWYVGRAEVLDDDDAELRLAAMRSRGNPAVVRLVGTDLLTLRIDLEVAPAQHNGARR